MANGLKDLLFNDRKKVFSDSWKKQGLYFVSSSPPASGVTGGRRFGNKASASSSEGGLGYGLEQRSGGPCGVLASVNAFVLRELLFSAEGDFSSSAPRSSSSSCDWKNPTEGEQRSALVRAMATMLLTSSTSRSNQGREVVVCLPITAVGGGVGAGAQLYRSGTYTPDGFTERAATVTVNIPLASPEELERRRGASEGGGGGDRDDVGVFNEAVACLARWLLPHLPTSFEDPLGSGALLFLASVVLTRGIDNVKADMDEGFAGEVRRAEGCLHIIKIKRTLLLLSSHCPSLF
jgi:hypothetical protein